MGKPLEIAVFKGSKETHRGFLHSFIFNDNGVFAVVIIPQEIGERVEKILIDNQNTILPVSHTLDVIFLQVNKALAERQEQVLELTKLISEFPGHIAEQAWAEWLKRREELLKKITPGE